VPQDVARARAWYERAAALGLPRALNALGRLYLTGEGGRRNSELARELFEKAAAGGDAFAMNNIGLLYLNGYGVERDEAVAKSWFEKAATLGDTEAQANLARLDEAARSGYQSLGLMINARRTACVQSCRSHHRNYVTWVCARYFPDAPLEQGERRDCIDLSLRLTARCAGSCREWAQLAMGENACEECLHAFLACSAKDRGAAAGRSSPEAQYAEVSRTCLAGFAQCSGSCPAK
jgi:TPR repeat protein